MNHFLELININWFYFCDQQATANVGHEVENLHQPVLDGLSQHPFAKRTNAHSAVMRALVTTPTREKPLWIGQLAEYAHYSSIFVAFCSSVKSQNAHLDHQFITSSLFKKLNI